MGVSLLDGWLPWALLVLGIAGGAFLLARRERWWWLYVVPGTVVVSAVLAWILGNTVARSVIGQDLTFSDQVWIAVALAGIFLAIASLFRTPWWRKAVAILAGLLVVAMAGNQINKTYAQFPRLGDLFGPSVSDGALPARGTAASSSALPAEPLTRAWTPIGANIPTDGGKVTAIALPGTTSGFQPRESFVYLPPAYFADNPEPLPVLLLIHGQPGDPAAWTSGDRIKNVMDAYAAEHNGISPVVVMPDGTGSQTDNPLCADTNLSNVGKYLSQDVPAAVKSQLLVDPRPDHWAVGGFSYGGTCAFQLATKYPDIFPTFLDFSGEEEPSLGSHADTVQRAFAGDEAKFKTINPLDLLAANRYPNSAGWFVVGADDPTMRPGLTKLYAAAQASGMDVQYREMPGLGHDWNVPFLGLPDVMPWLAQRLDLTGPDASPSPSDSATASATGSPAPSPSTTTSGTT